MIARETLVGQVGSAFRVVGGACDSVELRLAELTDGKAAPGFEVFSLFLQGPAAPQLDQATYTLDHPVLGTIALFLVPVEAVAGGIRYEALFNRRRSE